MDINSFQEQILLSYVHVQYQILQYSPSSCGCVASCNCSWKIHRYYILQMNRSRREADDTMVQLEEQKRHTSRVQREGEHELDKVCFSLLEKS